MVLASVCSPALIYLVFSLTQVTIDTMHGHYNKAFIKLWVCMIFTLLLNHLCQRGLGLVSWIIVFIPFLLMSIIVTMLLVMFGFDPNTGKLAIYDKTNNRVIKQPRAAPPLGNPLDARSDNFDYTNFEEPNMSEQQKDMLDGVKQRRSDASDKDGKGDDESGERVSDEYRHMFETGKGEIDENPFDK